MKLRGHFGYTLMHFSLQNTDFDSTFLRFSVSLLLGTTTYVNRMLYPACTWCSRYIFLCVVGSFEEPFYWHMWRLDHVIFHSATAELVITREEELKREVFDANFVNFMQFLVNAFNFVYNWIWKHNIAYLYMNRLLIW